MPLAGDPGVVPRAVQRRGAAHQRAWLVGAIILAVSLRRAGQAPTAIAVALPITWLATIPLATVGGGVISGAYYLALGYLLVNQASTRISSVAAQPANG